MKNDKFQRAFGNIDPRLIERAGNVPVRHTKSKFISIIAAVLSVCLCIGLFTWIGRENTSPIIPSATTVTAHPVTSKTPMWIDAGVSEDYSNIDVSKYLLLSADYPEKVNISQSFDRSWIDDFLMESISCFLSGRGDSNSVYSPINVYFSLAVMAELEEGEIREQILELLGANSIEELRKNSYDIWNRYYAKNEATKCIFANSLWLNEGTVIEEETLQILKESYYATVYQGDFSSEECVLAYRAWLNENTDGLVDKLSDVALDPNADMANASAITFNNQWQNKFFVENNTTKVFHSTNGDVEVEFMNKDIGGEYYYWGDNFSSVKLKFQFEGGGMLFIMPDENVSMDTLLSDSEFLSFVVNSDDWENRAYPQVNLSVPKFEIQSDMELTQGLKSLGLGTVNIKSNHGAGVVIDERGVKASAYTANQYYAMAPEDEVDFILDRPFIFVIMGDGGLPLFVGIVNNP